jgi:ATP synthase protein I
MSSRANRAKAWADAGDKDEHESFKPLSREEAQILAARQPSISPWRVIAVQALVGLAMAAAVALFQGSMDWVWSVLYGAATVVVPGALMARGMTSQLTSLSPGVSAVSFMLWEFGKIGVSVAMLALASKVVPNLSWPALLVALVVCIKVYWVALSWRGRSKS